MTSTCELNEQVIVNSGHRHDQQQGQGPVKGGGNAALVITFSEFRLDTARRLLSRNGRRVRIQSKPLNVLMYLASRADRVVTRQELMEAFWPSGIHEEALTRCVSIVRKLLDDTREPPRYIETVWGEGYRFVARVGTDETQPAARTAARLDAQRPRQPVPPSQPSRPLTSWRTGWTVALLAMAGVAMLAAAWLWSTRTRETALPVERIAVMPMASPSPADDWLAEALTDQLADTISRIEGVIVITRGSTKQFSPRPNPREIGRLLGVDALLVSQLDRSGERVGMRSQLVSATDGRVLWSFAVAPAADVVQPAAIEQLAASVAQRLWAKLRVASPTRRINAEAYRLYLRGRYFWNQRSKTALDEAIAAFKAALAIDPDYADAHVGLADSWLLMPLYGAVPPTQAIPRARQAAIRALELNPSARAMAVLGVIAMQYDWDWTEAEARLREALTLDPNDATTEQWLGQLYCYRLRFDECRRHLQTAAGLDPLSPVLQLMQGSPALFSGDFAAAIEAYEQARERSPGFAFTRYFLGLSHAGLGDWAAAIADYR
ncbi:MAG: winged helix-turn-helix domain-containing protein, partial [Lysobacterales bacterium]